jgi:DNA-directed RNA polymerase subunit RPC12/RpoP
MPSLTIRSQNSAGAKHLARQLKTRVPDLACQACSHRDFALIEAPDDAMRTTLRRVNLSARDDVYLAQQTLLTVICTNCGHIEQFAEAVIDGIDPDKYGKDHTGD